MNRPEQMVVRGLIAGVVGATALVIWFLVIDTVAGRPFHTPAFLASVLANVEGVDRSFGLVAMYTAVHYIAFIMVGILTAWLLQQLEIAPNVLLGLVLGFLLFDLIFYFGLSYNGIHVVRELGWVEVFSGSLLAGLAVMATLHLTTRAPAVTWWQVIAKHRILREGIIAGLIGAGAVAAWFLILDLARGQIFFTPGALGSVLFLGVNDLADVHVNLLTVSGYTAIHVSAFVVVGLIAAVILSQAEDTPPILLGAVLIFAAFEAFFLGLVAMLAEWLLGALSWWAIGLGNLIATVAMAYYLWRKHPTLQASLAQHPLDGSSWEPKQRGGDEAA